MSMRRVCKITALVFGLGVGSTLSAMDENDALSVARDHLESKAQSLQLSAADLSTMAVKNHYVSKHNGVTHIYLRQMHNDLEVIGGELSIHLAANGSVIKLNNQFVKGIEKVRGKTPKINSIQAVTQTATHLNLQITQALTPLQTLDGNSFVLSRGGISQDDIPVKLVYLATGGSAELAWQMVLRLHDNTQWLDVRTSATSGKVLDVANWVAHASDYLVFPVPEVSPEDASTVNVQTRVLTS